MSSWTYLTCSVKEAPEKMEGFVYQITHIKTGKSYIGKKSLWSRRTVKVKNRKNRKHILKESNWRSYFGSCKELKADVEKHGPAAFERRILRFCKTKRDLSYWEVFYQFSFDVLTENYYNRNIMGRWFRSDGETKTHSKAA